MKSITLSELRKSSKEVLDQITNSKKVYTLKRPNGKAVVLIDEDVYNNLIKSYYERNTTAPIGR